jgi:hypothetical protein
MCSLGHQVGTDRYGNEPHGQWIRHADDFMDRCDNRLRRINRDFPFAVCRMPTPRRRGVVGLTIVKTL